MIMIQQLIIILPNIEYNIHYVNSLCSTNLDLTDFMQFLTYMERATKRLLSLKPNT